MAASKGSSAALEMLESETSPPPSATADAEASPPEEYEVEEEEEVEEEQEEDGEEEEEDGDAAVDGEARAKAEGPEPAPAVEEAKKWPGWPGDSVFRMIVPVLKVGSIIGRKGELVKKMCEETRARVRILEGPIGTADRIVLISGREETEAAISPAMNAALRVFKRVNGLSDSEDDTIAAPAGPTVCSVRLLVAASQAISLIGKGGTLIKSIQEGSGATIRVLSGDDVPFYATEDERIIEIQGHPLNVLKALEGVVGHLRKFLVDHSVIPLFEKSRSSSAASVPQDRAVDAWAEKTTSLMPTSQTGIGSDYKLPLKRDSLFLGRETQFDSRVQQHSGLSLYGQDPAISGLGSSGLGRASGAFVTQVTQTMQIPLSYAEDIIGIAGKNIAHVRRNSGAIVTLQESRGLPDEMIVEIKGTTTQVQTAQQLMQEFMGGRKEPAVSSYSSSYGGYETGLRSSYSQLSNTSYPSSLTSQSYGGYGSSGVGGYGIYRF
uniref:Poly(RC)-binding protein 3 n=1 Tax=Anthurium amnicola TaxID=1678845 RepID=A0A1D1ZHI2_9ARAE